MFYRVRISPTPTATDAEGKAVADTRVLEIMFPGDHLDTPTGRVNFIVGPGVAKISVAGETIRGVPLC
ncbi:hypothetical protein [Sphingomonas sp. UYP23]